MLGCARQGSQDEAVASGSGHMGPWKGLLTAKSRPCQPHSKSEAATPLSRGLLAWSPIGMELYGRGSFSVVALSSNDLFGMGTAPQPCPLRLKELARLKGSTSEVQKLWKYVDGDSINSTKILFLNSELNIAIVGVSSGQLGE